MLENLNQVEKENFYHILDNMEVEELLRLDRFPTIFCDGCGLGTLMYSLLKALIESNIDLDKVVLVSGIGCSSRIPGYIRLDSLHTTHGRAIAFATGIKLANPELKVIVITGDGDLAAIGGNHFIHACRRNIDLLVICANNLNYGMTGGQVSPTTFRNLKTTTTPYGNHEPAFDLCKIAVAAGANYVARYTILTPELIKESIKKALFKEGLSYIEVITQCVTGLGKRNKLSKPIDMLNWIKERIMSIHEAKELEEKGIDINDKIIIGEYIDRNRPGLLRIMGLIKEKKEEAKEVILKEYKRKIKEDKKLEEIIRKMHSPIVRRMIEEGRESMEIEKRLLEKS